MALMLHDGCPSTLDRPRPRWRWSGALPRQALLLALLGLGCAGSSAQRQPLSYAKNAAASYRQGVAALEDEDYAEATRSFEFVKAKYPFSRFATLAELRLADVLFAQESYTAAIDAYKIFLGLHPNHPETRGGYAAYRVALAYVKQIPSDWFIVPPSYEKDQAATRGAVRELASFLRDYGETKYAAKGRELYRRCLHSLVEHELYVARFYLDNDKPKAAILRLEAVLRQYPALGVETSVRLLLGQTYLKLQQRMRARETFLALIREHPGDVNSAKAKLFLERIDEN
ncbi:MAG: outer membrane protein assembly factor BamD [Proteobacteria bacterium]|nr:outer membrane protein assembly factor BamD [Pseudomonadota bacterium]